jgi:hypothetical protein
MILRLLCIWLVFFIQCCHRWCTEPWTWKVSLFRADSLDRCKLQCAWDPSVLAMDKTAVGLNVATRSCNVYPDKCWFAVLCRFWLQCNRTLTYRCCLVRQSASVLYLARLDGPATSPSPRQDWLLYTDRTEESALHFRCWAWWAIIARTCAHTKHDRFWSVTSCWPARLMTFKKMLLNANI